MNTNVIRDSLQTPSGTNAFGGGRGVYGDVPWRIGLRDKVSDAKSIVMPKEKRGQLHGRRSLLAGQRAKA